MQIKNRLSVMMAEKGIRSVSELQRMIEAKGLTIARRTLDKFYNNESNRIDYDTLATICTVLGCDVGDLLVMVEDEGEK